VFKKIALAAVISAAFLCMTTEQSSARGGRIAWRRAGIGWPANWRGEHWHHSPGHYWGAVSWSRGPTWGYGPLFGYGPGWDSWGGYYNGPEYDLDACWIRDPDDGGWIRRCY
jgi:hypothetical protein